MVLMTLGTNSAAQGGLEKRDLTSTGPRYLNDRPMGVGFILR
jgi:hypothetical protein